MDTIADKPHTARKAGKCCNYGPAVAGNAPECHRMIAIGDTYFDGDIDPYKAGGFGKDRVCVGCRKAGHA
jgi:hypothetical protein